MTAGRRVLVVTGARSEFGLMRWVMDDLQTSDWAQLEIAACGSHYMADHGDTWREIESSGFEITLALRPPPRGDSSSTCFAGALVSDLTLRLTQALQGEPRDLVLVMGDRYELLGVMNAALLTGTPIAHVSGGEITEGAIDEQIRHAMTKAAHLHFVANEDYADNVARMGEEQWRICVSGEPGLDAVERLARPSAREFMEGLGWPSPAPTVLVTLHPVTHERAGADAQLAAFASALERFMDARGARALITYPNADMGSDAIIKTWRALAERRPQDVRLERSLGHARYLAALEACDLMAGNSSSALVEAPSFGLPAVNVGARQAGRIRAANVMDCAAEETAVYETLIQALDRGRIEGCENPYRKGDASRTIVRRIGEVLQSVPRETLLKKRFAGAVK